MIHKSSLDTKREQVLRYMKNKGYEVAFIKYGIRGVASGSVGPIVITKNNVIKIRQ